MVSETMDMERWSTAKAPLAAYLSLMGFTVVSIEWQGGSCYWTFEDGEQLADAVADFEGGKARVDPNRFNDAVADIKRSMFVGPLRKGTVISLFDDRGYGFIDVDDEDGEEDPWPGDLFFHVNDINPEHKEHIKRGSRVNFRIEARRDGRPIAKHVRIHEA